jgi:O6-methylguanine-DNA--protein-cysteine methyltransferase
MQLAQWHRAQEEALDYAENNWKFDPDHKNDHINHDTRKHKSEFLDYRISLLLRHNGDGMGQKEIYNKLKPIPGEVITYSAIKTAINRMESVGRVKTSDVSTSAGKRVIVRLIAKL